MDKFMDQTLKLLKIKNIKILEVLKNIFFDLS